MTGLESSGWRETGLAQQRMLRIIMHRQIQRVELICRVLICNLLGFVQISVGSFCFLSSLRLLRDGSAVEDNLQGENGEEFSQNGPSYTYEMGSVDEYFKELNYIFKQLDFKIFGY